MPEGTKSVEFHYRKEGASKPESMWFMAEQQNECDEVAHVIAAAVNRPHTESRTNETLFNVAAIPTIMIVLSAILAGVLYASALDVAAGKQVVAQGRHAGMKQLIAWIAGLLGVQGSLAVGILLVAICLAWLIKNVIIRPQVLTLQFSAAGSDQ